MATPLRHVARLCAEKVVGNGRSLTDRIGSETPVLIMLAAGKGTRFGRSPKCVQPVAGRPLARHSLDAFAGLSSAPGVCLVGYEADHVAEQLGDDQLFVLSDNPAGGTALAAMEAFSVKQLDRVDPIVVVTMGDRVVPQSIFRELLSKHRKGSEAALTILTAIYEPPRNHGKGRIVRDADGKIVQIIEQRDLEAVSSPQERQRLQQTTEGNCPLYAIRASALKRYLGQVTEDNAQGQYYFTDIVEAIHRDGGVIRSVTVAPSDPEYDVLCADVTRADDLPKLQRALDDYASNASLTGGSNVDEVASSIAQVRAEGQTRSIAMQLEEISAIGKLEELGFDPDKPIGIGISGGRLRIAFMHPDMGRFFGPAWQMPIGALNESGREQIVVAVQVADDNLIRLYPTKSGFREQVNAIAADLPCMFPGEEVVDGYSYESFGTAMTEQILSTLGYYSDEQVEALRSSDSLLPSPQRWVGNAMRRPFPLLANVLASFRTVRDGSQGRLIECALGKEHFHGLRVASTGEIPQGGFSSSSAVTVAAINAIDALYDLRFSADQKVELACQSEFGTGVRAGALDQATEQKGQFQQGTLISSNPKDHYRILGTFPVPAQRFRVLFPYTVDRDASAWQWSAGTYDAASGGERLTSIETRKMTGKACELAAILMRLPLDIDLFEEIQDDVIETGTLTPSSMLHVRDRLAHVPLRATQHEIRALLESRLDWYVDQRRLHDREFTNAQAQRTFESLLEGWRDPLLSRLDESGNMTNEVGAPLRAMVAYLYAEVVKNCYLIHHPKEWIRCVTQSQRGDRCFDIDFRRLPSKREMMRELRWESDVSGPKRMQRWLERFDASPFDFNRGLEDDALNDDDWSLASVAGTNFFRGLALIDLAEAMLKRAFGDSAVAVRVNGAGQGDYFQVHVDTDLVKLESVKEFIRKSVYRRFGLNPDQEFVEPQSGGGALGARLSRSADLLKLAKTLREISPAELANSDSRLAQTRQS